MNAQCPQCGVIVGRELLFELGDATVCPNCIEAYKQGLREGVPPPTRRSSPVGIASFVLSLIGGLGLFAIFGYAGYVEVSTPGGLDENSFQAVAIGLSFFFAMFLEFLAFVLGLVGLLQKNTSRLFAGLGLGLSVAGALLAVSLMVIGVLAEGQG
jgi:hypothetical protein